MNIRQTRPLLRLLAVLIGVAIATQPAPAAVMTENLPDIGSSARVAVPQSEEYQIGRVIMRQLRESGALLGDPVIDEYIQSLGERLATHAHDGEHRFTFFVVNDPSINAFALPGGFIGIHHGLLLATKNEHELASVLAHEVAHVTQAHIARMIEAGSEANLLTTAAVLAAIVLGGMTGAGGDAMQAAIAVAQGTAIQNQINFTRSHEYEADRVGIRILADSGFDPAAMPDFFETLSRRSPANPNVPDFLMTHPVSSERIAETRNRAANMPVVRSADSPEYALAGARIRVLTAKTPDEAIEYFRGRAPGINDRMSAGERYGFALALLRAGRAEPALREFETLLARDENVIAFQIGKARSLMALQRKSEAMAVYKEAYRLSPRNVPLTMAYSEALMEGGEAAEAHRLMLDLANNVNYTPEQIRLLALAASAAGDTADAHYYMSEFHVLNGELNLAVNLLQLAVAAPDLDGVQRARFQARLDEIQKYLKTSGRRRPARNASDSSPRPEPPRHQSRL